MFLSQLILNSHNKIVRKDLANCYELHRTIMSAFPVKENMDNGARAEFNILFRLENDYAQHRIILLVQSEAQPDWSKLPEGYLYSNNLTTEAIQSSMIKDISPIMSNLKNDLILRFKLLANPTKKIETSTKEDRINNKRKHGQRIPIVNEQEQINWITKKGNDHGFEIIQLKNEIYNLGITKRLQIKGSITEEIDNNKERKSLKFQGVNFEGVLKIKDQEKFKETMKNGIGTAKAFGFGLLTISAIK